MANYELWLDRDDGTRLAEIDDFESLVYNMSLHQVGACSLVLPDGFDETLLAADRRLEVWRQPSGGKLQLERTYFLRGLKDWTDKQGVRRIQITGLDGNYLPSGRIIAYAAGSAQASQTGTVDNIMKEIVRDNLGSDAAAARQVSSTYFSVQANTSEGTTITKAFSWRNVLTVLQDLTETARAAGTTIYFDMTPVTPTVWEFRTRSGQLGQDHTYPNGIGIVLLGLEYGNLEEPTREVDWSDEITYVYCGGQGEGAARAITEVSDTTRLNRSLFGRREAFQDARGEDSANGRTASANARLAEGRPRVKFSGKIVDSEGTKYGLHWRFGDKLSAIYRGQQYDGVVKAVEVKVDSTGKEEIEARLETVE